MKTALAVACMVFIVIIATMLSVLWPFVQALTSMLFACLLGGLLITCLAFTAILLVRPPKEVRKPKQ